MSIDNHINFNLPLPVLLGSFLLAFLIVPIIVAVLAIQVYQSIYEDVRRDMLAMMEAREKARPVSQLIRSAPATHAPVSPFEPVCRHHNGILDVTVLWRSGQNQAVKVTCHDGYTTFQ